MKVWYHNGALFLEPYFLSAKELSAIFSKVGHEARRAMKEAGSRPRDLRHPEL